MHTIEAYGKIEGGKLVLSNRRRFEEDISLVKDVDVILVVKKRGRRSNQQNRYYWGVIVQEVQLRFKALGHRLNAEEVHQFLKEKFIPVHLHDAEGVLLAILPGTTTGMNKTEFSDYIEQIREWAGQVLEINIPDASSKNELNF